MVAKPREVDPISESPGPEAQRRPRASQREKIDLKKIEIKILPSKVTIGLRGLRRRRA